jgi:hypothetical protein|tara:strand:- start:877 stop:1179 length:303 start_codon:yes stop_codon:yes gene_type:complete
MKQSTKNKVSLDNVTANEWDSIRGIKEEEDLVNSPPHYNKGGIECIDGIEAMLTREEFIGYLRGNSFKYRWRFPYKNGIEDLKKGEWYENRLLEVLGSNG